MKRKEKRVTRRLTAAGLILVAFACATGACGSSDDKDCRDACEKDDECKSGLKCLTTAGSKKCVPKECANCGGNLVCNYTMDEKTKECAFTSCT